MNHNTPFYKWIRSYVFHLDTGMYWLKVMMILTSRAESGLCAMLSQATPNQSVKRIWSGPSMYSSTYTTARLKTRIKNANSCTQLLVSRMAHPASLQHLLTSMTVEGRHTSTTQYTCTSAPPGCRVTNQVVPRKEWIETYYCSTC